MIFCTFDGFRKNRPKSIYNCRSFYYNRNVRLFIKSASARRSKPAPVHSTVCLSYHVFHKKKEVSVSTENFFAPIFRLSQKYMCSSYENSGKTTAEFMQICENFLQSRNPLELGLLPTETAGCQPRPQEQTPIFRRRFRWSKCSVQKEAIL